MNEFAEPLITFSGDSISVESNTCVKGGGTLNTCSYGGGVDNSCGNGSKLPK